MFRIAPYNQNLVKRNNEFDNMFTLMDNFFTDLPSTEFVKGFKVDIQDNEDTYLLEADLPGFNKEDILVDYKQDNLIIQVESKKEEEEKTSNYIRKERSRQSMKRVFRIKDIQKEGITAKFEQGVLQIVVPKQEKIQEGFSIEIQ